MVNLQGLNLEHDEPELHEILQRSREQWLDVTDLRTLINGIGMFPRFEGFEGDGFYWYLNPARRGPPDHLNWQVSGWWARDGDLTIVHTRYKTVLPRSIIHRRLYTLLEPLPMEFAHYRTEYDFVDYGIFGEEDEEEVVAEPEVPEEQPDSGSESDEDAGLKHDDEIVESDVELDNSDVVEPDNEPSQPMGDSTVEVTDENRDAAQSEKSKAMEAAYEENFDEAVAHLTQAIKLNPTSAKDEENPNNNKGDLKMAGREEEEEDSFEESSETPESATIGKKEEPTKGKAVAAKSKTGAGKGSTSAPEAKESEAESESDEEAADLTGSDEDEKASTKRKVSYPSSTRRKKARTSEQRRTTESG